ncbi:DUF6415 family natural product biosynthesis protein [Streptomyces sp. YS415]|uniref:DUF6415 family natural product biosynthesis protein n=1 Tax=Streptomyces sp. YS415 TaxID=2944806 RepID=UPI0020222D39|nr:DUF6415 family natural product biosynthesis protein [Streptomyces sp. YS415]MCL7425397.1 DUF6415 family natural product biosynthesis protein [Streptomyces sp. YS415]
MRATVARVLPPDATPVDLTTLETLTGLLCSHMELLIPEIQQAAAGLPADDVPRYCALVALREARMKLDARPGLRPYDSVTHVRRLGRSLLALCDHYETLTGVRACLACDQPLKLGETTHPFVQGSQSGGAAVSGRIHERCGNTVRIR